MLGGGNSALLVAIMHTGGVIDTPVVNVSRGADVGFFVGGSDTGISNAGIEWWIINPVTEITGAVQVDFDPGVSVTIIVCAIEVANYGRQGPDGPAVANGILASSFNTSITVSDSLGGEGQTLFVPSTLGLVLAAGGIYNSFGGVSASNGTTELTTSAGSGGTRIAFAVSWIRATGGSDTMSFACGAGSEWGEVILAPWGCAVNGIIRCTGVLPRVR